MNIICKEISRIKDIYGLMKYLIIFLFLNNSNVANTDSNMASFMV